MHVSIQTNIVKACVQHEEIGQKFLLERFRQHCYAVYRFVVARTLGLDGAVIRRRCIRYISVTENQPPGIKHYEHLSLQAAYSDCKLTHLNKFLYLYVLFEYSPVNSAHNFWGLGVNQLATS